MADRSTCPRASVVPFVLIVPFVASTPGHAQQTTGQLLISSGFNPIAATTPAMMARLMSFPANRFLLRQKEGRPYYVYGDPSAYTSAYVGIVAAKNKYRASFGALSADVLSSGASPTPSRT